MTKKITALLLAVCLVTGSVLSNINVIPVKAAAATAVSIDTQAEMLLAIYSVLETGMIAGGAKEGMDNYESSKSLADAFMSFVDTMTLPDGKKFEMDCVDEAGNKYEFVGNDLIITDVNGQVNTITGRKLSDVIVLPGEDTAIDEDLDGDGDFDLDDYIANKQALRDAKLHELFEMYYEDCNNGGGSGDSGNSGDDNNNQKKPFSKIKAITVGTGLLAAAGAFISALWNDEIDGIEQEKYFYGEIDNLQKYYWNGFYEIDSNENFVIKGNTKTINETYTSIGKYSYKSNKKIYGYYESGLLWFAYYENGSLRNINLPYAFENFSNKTGELLNKSTTQSMYLSSSVDYSFNFPIFNTKTSLLQYINQNIELGLLNGAPYDYLNLASSVPQSLDPLTGKSYSPNAQPGINNALATAAAAVEPDTSVDTDTNTQTYIDTITETMTEVEPEALPDNETVNGGDVNTPTDTELDDSISDDFKDFINAILILFYILFVLLKIFLHCLEFIINIFKIPATTGYLNDEMIFALEYLKGFEIEGMSISIYDFLFGLLYIIILFFLIGVLRKNIDRIKIPKQLHSKKG